MNTLVTGGGGFLGRYIVERLLVRGDSVRIFSRGAYPELRSLGINVVQGDLRSAAEVSSACKNIDAVFHVAALPGVWGPWKTYYEINTLGTRNVLEACRANGVPKLVYTSSPSVVYDGHGHLNATEDLPYPNSFMCHYPHSKALAEREVLEAGAKGDLLTVALRPHLIWGPRDNHLIPRLIQRAKAGRLLRVGTGSNVVSMSYVENVAHAHLLACDALSPGSPVCGQAYFINEPEPVNLWNWIDDLLQLAGLPKLRRRVSSTMAWTIGAALEGIFTLARLSGEPPMTRFVASQLSQSHSYSIEKASRDFGYAPIVSVSEGMQRLTPELRRLAQG